MPFLVYPSSAHFIQQILHFNITQEAAEGKDRQGAFPSWSLESIEADMNSVIKYNCIIKVQSIYKSLKWGPDLVMVYVGRILEGLLEIVTLEPCEQFWRMNMNFLDENRASLALYWLCYSLSPFNFLVVLLPDWSKCSPSFTFQIIFHTSLVFWHYYFRPFCLNNSQVSILYFFSALESWFFQLFYEYLYLIIQVVFLPNLLPRCSLFLSMLSQTQTFSHPITCCL